MKIVFWLVILALACVYFPPMWTLTILIILLLMMD